MKYTFFTNNYIDMNELRQHYKELCLKYHPDKHSEDTESYTKLFQALQAEYSQILIDFIPGQNAKAKQGAQTWTVDSESELAQVIADLMKYPGLIIEVCGSWLWLTGSTYKWKSKIKNLGFRWQHRKQSWYFAGYEFKPHKARIMPMDHIRARYGSMILETEQRQAIA